MKLKKARNWIRQICVANTWRDRFAPDPKQLKNKSADLKDPTALVCIIS